MNALTEPESLRAPFREMYKKRIDEYADVLYGLSKNIQQNSLGQIMLEPNYSKRVLGEFSKSIHISDVRKTMGLKIRERKCDTLTRCSCCVYLGEKMMDGPTETDKKEASRMYKNHMQIIKFLPNNSKFAYNFFSQQRIITETISRLSRDQEEDILHLSYDAMSNKSSKLPIMNNMKGRPKCIPDSDQIPLTVTTVQVSQQHEFAKVVRNMPSVASVEMAPTIYNFETLNDFVHKPTHLLSNNQIILSKDSNGEFVQSERKINHILGQIVWSASQTMSSSELFCFEGEEDSFPLFKDTFDPSSFTPLIEAPIKDHVQVKIDHLLKSASPFFTATNRDEYEKCFDNYGTEAFRNVIRLLNEKPSKVDVDQQQDYDVKHNTVLNYLASKGINPGKRPKRPILTKEMRKK
ncbi:hypothetical protein CAEBREN_21838 [Caenorhabditis brenneri]|uniref:Uncharacterized protein n=1 Tax=Caenorhabditis brenneri TaxID=135651 RepID=G0MA91_CAEBE|nr:hypothetical protein CAEBREN_21838 [Caenorhabditis brenneri]